jgi:predicted RNA-binding Zn-ribbon protein involved in translation (DUF1610 family)
LIIVYGIYRFRPKRITFRNDYCLSCGVPGRSVQFRTFDALHLFWIPLLPLGFHKQWRCATCGRQPHVYSGARRGFQWAGLAVLLVFAAAFWAGGLKPDTMILGWVVRVAAPIGAVLTLVHLLRTPKNASLAEKLAAIPAASDTVCPFCGFRTPAFILRVLLSCVRNRSRLNNAYQSTRFATADFVM